MSRIGVPEDVSTFTKLNTSLSHSLNCGLPTKTKAVLKCIVLILFEDSFMVCKTACILNVLIVSFRYLWARSTSCVLVLLR